MPLVKGSKRAKEWGEQMKKYRELNGKGIGSSRNSVHPRIRNDISNLEKDKKLILTEINKIDKDLTNLVNTRRNEHDRTKLTLLNDVIATKKELQTQLFFELSRIERNLSQLTNPPLSELSEIDDE